MAVVRTRSGMHPPGNLLAMIFHHVQLAIPTGGEEDARRFWVTVLGFEEVDKPPELADRGGAWFRMGTTEVHCGVEEDFIPARKAHPAFLVEALDGVAERLYAATRPVVWDDRLPGYRRFYSADPFGNRLEFLERS